MIEHTTRSVGQMPSQWTIDAGYCSAANLEHVKDIETAGGTEFFIATGRLKHGERVPDAPRGRIPANATPRERMARKLKTKRGRAVYARRKRSLNRSSGKSIPARANTYSCAGSSKPPANGSSWRVATTCSNSSNTGKTPGSWPPQEPKGRATEPRRPLQARPEATDRA
jgi:hypothetical protein